MRRTLFLSIAILPALVFSSLLLVACDRSLDVARVAEPQRVEVAARPADPEAYLPDAVEGWSIEPTQADEMPALEGLRLASMLMRPATGAAGEEPVILSAVVFHGAAGTDASMLPHVLGESARRVDMGDETVWELEAGPGSCVDMWPTSRDVLVMTAATTCEAATAAMRSVLGQ